MGFSRTFGHENSFRQLIFVSLDFRRKVFPWLKVHLGGRYSYEEIQFKIRVERKASPDPEKQVETYTKNIELLHNKWDRFLLQDAALQAYLGESLVLTVGQQTIVWGQLDTFSPVDFLLPVDLTSPLSFSKVDMRLPVKAAKLSWFPTSRLELQGYYFPEMTYDKNLKDQFEKDSGHTNKIFSPKESGI